VIGQRPLRDLTLAELERWLRRRWETEPVAAGRVGSESLTTLTWTAPTLINGNANYGSGWQEAGYVKDHMGFVHLRGLVNPVASTVMFVLPAGFRPANPQVFVAHTGEPHAVGRVDVAANGEVSFSSGNVDYITLSGITFDTRS
jgi:hypothetical protein